MNAGKDFLFQTRALGLPHGKKEVLYRRDGATSKRPTNLTKWSCLETREWATGKRTLRSRASLLNES